MTDVTKTMQVKVDGVDNTKPMFESLGQNIGKVTAASNGLASGLKTLGIAGAALYAGHELLNFFEEATQMAYDDEKATIRLNAAITSLGNSLSTATPQVRALEDQMLQFGYTAGETDKALTTILRTSGNLTEAITLVGKASDLAATTGLDLQTVSEALANLYTGKFRQAAMLLGIEMRDNATDVEVLDKVLGKITLTAQEMSDQQKVNIDEMRGKWEEFKSYLGGWALWFADSFADSQITAFRSLKNIFTGNISDMRAMLAEQTGQKEKTDALTKSILSYSDAQSVSQIRAHLIAQQSARDGGAAQQKYADTLKQSFRDVSKAVVSALNDQAKAIDDLSSSLTDIDNKLNNDLAKANQKYQADATNIARQAKSRIDDIDKQIADENSSRSQGFRDRIETLQKEKAKEQAIIDKAGQDVSNLQSQIAMDDLDQLRQAHAEELAELQAQAQKKKDIANAEIAARKKELDDIAKLVASPSFYTNASKEGGTFMGSVGAGGIQQVLNFTFNGNVTNEQAVQNLVRQVTDALNRTATLHGVAGK